MNYSDPLASRYEIQQQLAKKAGRRTLLARDLKTLERVVIKLLSFGIDFEWETLKLFEREAETLKSLSHPAIPRYLDFFEFNTPYSKGFALVQSYVEGKSLEAYLKAGKTFTEAQVKQLAKSLLEILTYLHGQKPPVIHRDIKPSNILLGNTEEIYLVDFGSVQTLAAKEGGTMTVVGTYGYMPPEQFGDRAVPASDLYSLGTTLIYLVTGIHPADLPHKNGSIQFESGASLSPEFTAWLNWMTQPNLDRRLSSAKEALAALEQPSVNLVPTISQPFGSKIRLYQNANSLEILLPSKGFSAEIISLSLFAIAWNSFLVFWMAITVYSAPMGLNLFFALFSLPFWSAGIGMIWRILSALFGKVRISLDRQQISRTYELLGIRFKQPRHSAPRNSINKLEVEYSHSAIRKIIIWAGTQKYELGNEGHIAASELDWLAQELSTWLETPITKKPAQKLISGLIV